MIMDLLRACYTTKMRFTEGDLTEYPVAWFFCNEGAQVFPTAHVFNSLNWVGDKFQITTAGEVEDAPRPFSYGVAPVERCNDATLARMRGQGFCGPEEWFHDPGSDAGAPLGTNERGFSWCGAAWPPRLYLHIQAVQYDGFPGDQLMFPGDVLGLTLQRGDGGRVENCTAAENGTVRVTYSYPLRGRLLAPEGTVFINGVQGTTEANGRWGYTNLTATTFDLEGTFFVNPYERGGLFANYVQFSYQSARLFFPDDFEDWFLYTFECNEPLGGLRWARGSPPGNAGEFPWIVEEGNFRFWFRMTALNEGIAGERWQFYIDGNPERDETMGPFFFPPQFFNAFFWPLFG